MTLGPLRNTLSVKESLLANNQSVLSRRHVLLYRLNHPFDVSTLVRCLLEILAQSLSCVLRNVDDVEVSIVSLRYLDLINSAAGCDTFVRVLQFRSCSHVHTATFPGSNTLRSLNASSAFLIWSTTKTHP